MHVGLCKCFCLNSLLSLLMRIVSQSDAPRPATASWQCSAAVAHFLMFRTFAVSLSYKGLILTIIRLKGITKVYNITHNDEQTCEPTRAYNISMALLSMP